jgi:hypothetical protein
METISEHHAKLITVEQERVKAVGARERAIADMLEERQAAHSSLSAHQASADAWEAREAELVAQLELATVSANAGVIADNGSHIVMDEDEHQAELSSFDASSLSSPVRVSISSCFSHA